MSRGFGWRSWCSVAVEFEAWRVALGVGLAVLVLTAPAAVARDIEQIESVGSAAIWREAVSDETGTPRDRAVRDALKEAVHTSALSWVAIVGELDLDRLAAALGDDPYVFVSRFHVVEDRGVQPALFNANPEVESEYRVIVEVYVDRDLIRERLVAGGMLEAPSGKVATNRTRIALEGLDDYQAYESIRIALLGGVGARSATPVEAMPGRIVLAVDSNLTGFELLRALEGAIPRHLELVPLQVDPDLLRLRVSIGALDLPEPEGDSSSQSQPALDPIDTIGRNRY